MSVDNEAGLVFTYASAMADCEKQYINIRGPLQESLQKAMEIRSAILAYELELTSAMRKFQLQLDIIEANFTSLNK